MEVRAGGPAAMDGQWYDPSPSGWPMESRGAARYPVA
jgi:hypothetical protein